LPGRDRAERTLAFAQRGDRFHAPLHDPHVRLVPVGSAQRSERSIGVPNTRSMGQRRAANQFRKSSVGALFVIPVTNTGRTTTPGFAFRRSRPVPGRGGRKVYGSAPLLRLPSGCIPMTVPGRSSSSTIRSWLNRFEHRAALPVSQDGWKHRVAAHREVHDRAHDVS
jgi:hypothetical protein